MGCTRSPALPRHHGVGRRLQDSALRRSRPSGAREGPRRPAKVREGSHGPGRRELVRRLAELCRKLGAEFVEPGIETTAAQVAVASECGCSLLHGGPIRLSLPTIREVLNAETR